MNPESAVAPSLQNHLARDYLSAALDVPQTIAPLPRVCAQLGELTAQEFIDAAQLARLIQSDPVLAGEVMWAANSPLLRPRSGIVSLQQAVSWLGAAEVSNIAMAVMLRGEAFVAPGHEAEAESLWREAWLAGLWAKELARERRKQVETAFLAALMHRTGAALALKILARFEREGRIQLDARAFGDLVMEFEVPYGRLLMNNWHLPLDVQAGACDWRAYRESRHSELAGTVHAAHLLATHTLEPQLLSEEVVADNDVFAHLGIFPDDRKAILVKRERMRALAGL